MKPYRIAHAQQYTLTYTESARKYNQTSEQKIYNLQFGIQLS